MKRVFLFILIVVLTVTGLSGCGNAGSNLTAEEGEAANGFLWENDYSEIVITGYEGDSNEIQVPETINGKPVTKIQENAFEGFKALTSVEIPGTVKIIDEVFKDCTGLKSVKLNSGLESMNSAFVGCTSLVSIEIPETVTAMKEAFSGCTALETVNVPAGVTELTNTFKECASLTTVELPEGITSLENTFSGCASLTTVNIPKSVTNLNSTFMSCTSLATAKLPDGVTYLENTFSGCTSLVNVNIPQTVTGLIGTFSNCSSLKTVEIPSGVNLLMSSPFNNCSSLISLTFPEGLAPGQIRDAFGQDGQYGEGVNTTKKALKTLVLPDSCESFSLDGFENLQEVTMSETCLESVLYASSDSKWSLCTETSATWYQELIQLAEGLSSYRYYTQTLDDGSVYRKITEDDSWYGDDVEPYVSEPQTNGNTTVQNYYYAAKTDDESEKSVVICETVTRIEGIDVSSSTEMYDESLGEWITYEYNYNDTIKINGVEYVVNP